MKGSFQQKWCTCPIGKHHAHSRSIKAISTATQNQKMYMEYNKSVFIRHVQYHNISFFFLIDSKIDLVDA
jgi:hypothetical protein